MLINYTTEEVDATTPPPSLAPMVLAICYTLSTIAVTMVSCRILVKAKLGKLAIEDALIVIATVVTVTLAVLTNCAVKWGFGLHIEDIPLSWWPMYSKYSFSMIAFAGVPYPLTKVSMLLFYLRLGHQPIFRKLCYGTIGYIVTAAVLVTLLSIFGCIPVRAGWDHDPALNARCVDPTRYLYFHTGINILTDIMLMTLPIPIIMKLQMQRKTKYGLVAMFAIGISITAVSAYNVYAMYVAYNSPDPIWDGAKSWLAAMAEFNAGIIVACMPSMLLFNKWLRGDMSDGKGPKPGSEHNDTIGGGGGGGGAPRRKYNPHSFPTETATRVGSQEYIMQDLDAKESPPDMLVVEVPAPPGSRSDGGSMC